MRDFVKNASNYMWMAISAVGSLLPGSRATSVAAWVQVDSTTTGAQENVVIRWMSSGSQGGLLFIDNTGANRLIGTSSRSQSGDSATAVTGARIITVGRWHHIGAVFDYASNRCRIYHDGSFDTAGAGAYGATSYQHSAGFVEDSLGGRSPVNTIYQLDGRAGEICVWGADIGEKGFAKLWRGGSPLDIMPRSLRLYFPLLGDQSPERCVISQTKGTITGTIVGTAHLPIYREYDNPWLTNSASSAFFGNQYYYRHIQAA